MKSNKKIIISSILILVLSAPIVYLLILFIDKVLLANCDWVIVEGTKDSWINFAGSIIGGLITMLVLYFTLVHANKEREEDKIKSVRPFVVVNPECKNNFDTSINESEDDCFYVIDTVVENISDNLVKDLALVEENVYIYNFDTKEFELLNSDESNYSIMTVLLDECEMIKPHDKVNYHTNFMISNYSHAMDDNAVCFKIEMVYRYRDIMDYVEYRHYFQYELNINYKTDGKFILFVQNIQNKLKEEAKIQE